MKPSYKCSKCDKRYTSRSTLTYHFEAHHTKQSKTFNCTGVNCIKSFCTQKRLKLHVYRVHTNNQRYNCELKCGKVLSSKNSLKLHMRTHTGEKLFICMEPNCAKSYISKESLNMHTASRHAKDRSFKCKECNKGNFSKRQLHIHIRNVHPLRELSCRLCIKTFKRQEDLYRHITAVHTKERPFKCEKCVFTFSTSGALKAHQMIHTDERRYCCTICGNKFKRSQSLTEHKVNLHALIKQEFQCPTSKCGKIFRTKKYLATHVHRRHNEKRKKYNCYFCSKSISAWSTFVTHVRIHTDEMPYNCGFKLCGYSTGNPNCLASHMKRSHSIWECYFCLKQFKFTADLSKHIWTHTRENYL